MKLIEVREGEMSQPAATVGFGAVSDASKCFCEPPTIRASPLAWGLCRGTGRRGKRCPAKPRSVSIGLFVPGLALPNSNTVVSEMDLMMARVRVYMPFLTRKTLH